MIIVVLEAQTCKGLPLPSRQRTKMRNNGQRCKCTISRREMQRRVAVVSPAGAAQSAVWSQIACQILSGA